MNLVQFIKLLRIFNLPKQWEAASEHQIPVFSVTSDTIALVLVAFSLNVSFSALLTSRILKPYLWGATQSSFSICLIAQVSQAFLFSSHPDSPGLHLLCFSFSFLSMDVWYWCAGPEIISVVQCAIPFRSRNKHPNAVFFFCRAA